MKIPQLVASRHQEQLEAGTMSRSPFVWKAGSRHDPQQHGLPIYGYETDLLNPEEEAGTELDNNVKKQFGGGKFEHHTY